MRRGVLLLAASSLLFATLLFIGQALRPSIPAASSTSSGDTRVAKASMSVDHDRLAAATSTSPEVVATIPVGDQPQGLDVDPLINRVYVASEGSVFVIDGVSNTL